MQAQGSHFVFSTTQRGEGDCALPRVQVVKAHSKVHGGGTVYSLQLRVSQGSLPDSSVQVPTTNTFTQATCLMGDKSGGCSTALLPRHYSNASKC